MQVVPAALAFLCLQWCCDNSLALKESLLSFLMLLRQQSCLDSSNPQGEAESNYRPFLGGGAVHPRPSFLFDSPAFVSFKQSVTGFSFFLSFSTLFQALTLALCDHARTALLPWTIMVYISPTLHQRIPCRWVTLLSTTLVCTVCAPCTAAGSARFPFTIQ